MVAAPAAPAPPLLQAAPPLTVTGGAPSLTVASGAPLQPALLPNGGGRGGASAEEVS